MNIFRSLALPARDQTLPDWPIRPTSDEQKRQVMYLRSLSSASSLAGFLLE